MGRAEPAVDTVILKVAAPCNLDCTYCYEYQGDDSWRSMPPLISEQTVGLLVKRITEHAQEHGLETVSVNTHGGEPMLMGAARLDALFEQLTRGVDGGVTLRLGMQTNATLATPEIVEVLVKHGVSVGVSIDGDRRGNERRIRHDQRPAFDEIIAGLETLKVGGAKISGGLCVINQDADPVETIRFLAELSFRQIDLLQPYGTHDSPPATPESAWSLGDWWLTAFSEWISDPALHKVRVRFFEDALHAVVRGTTTSDWFGNVPRDYIVVRSDGSYEGMDTMKVTGGDGRVLDMHVGDHSIDEASQHPHVRDLTDAGNRSLIAPECEECPVVDWCGGGYLPTRFGRGRGYRNPSIYCRDLQVFFSGVAKWVVEESGLPDEIRERVQRVRSRLHADGVRDRSAPRPA